MAKTFLNSKLSDQNGSIIKDPGLHIISDSQMTKTAELINTIQSKSNVLSQEICDGSSNGSVKVMTFEQFLIHSNIDINELKKNAMSDQSISNDCCVCFENIEQRIGLIPCGHTTVCEKCVSNARDKKCPLCRQLFTEYVKLFL